MGSIVPFPRLQKRSSSTVVLDTSRRWRDTSTDRHLSHRVILRSKIVSRCDISGTVLDTFPPFIRKHFNRQESIAPSDPPKVDRIEVQRLGSGSRYISSFHSETLELTLFNTPLPAHPYGSPRRRGTLSAPGPSEWPGSLRRCHDRTARYARGR